MPRLLCLALLPWSLALRQRHRSESFSLAPPSFFSCEDEAPCTPASAPGVESRFTGDVLAAGYRRMRELDAAGRQPVLVHLGADGLRNSAKWSDMHLYWHILTHAGLPASAIRMAFVEPMESKAPDFWSHIKQLGLNAGQVSLTSAMMDGACPDPTRSLYKISDEVLGQFHINPGIASGWVSTDKMHPIEVIRAWVDNKLLDWQHMYPLRWSPNITDYIEELPVPCYTLHSLLQKLDIDARDVAMLIVDIEGLDEATLQPMMAEPDFKPGFIQYEGSYRGDTPLQVSLRERGYEVGSKPGFFDGLASDSPNIVAVLPKGQ